MKNSVKKTELSIQGALGSLYGILRIPENKEKLPLMIMSHGFGANLNSLEPYAVFFSEHGFAVYSYDFGGGGYAPNRSEGTMLQMSVLTEAKDLQSVLNHFKDDERFSSIILLGASQGGFVSAYEAAKNNSLIRALVLLYPAFVLQDDARKRMQADGTFPEQSHIFNWTVSRKYNEDAISFDIYNVIRDYHGPVLILHGDQDPIVPLSYSKKAVSVFPDARLIIMPGQGHGFNAEGDQEACPKILEFLNTVLTDQKE